MKRQPDSGPVWHMLAMVAFAIAMLAFVSMRRKDYARRCEAHGGYAIQPTYGKPTCVRRDSVVQP